MTGQSRAILWAQVRVLLNYGRRSGTTVAFSVPLLMAATGYALDLRKVVVYPIPHGQLFQIDLLLRLLTSLEMLILTTGAVIGAAFNPALPKWGIIGFAAFAAFNIFVGSGVKELLARA